MDFACAFFDEDIMACSDIVLYITWCHSYAEFVVFDFFYTTDDHYCTSLLVML